jgi:hypothetical protein
VDCWSSCPHSVLRTHTFLGRSNRQKCSYMEMGFVTIGVFVNSNSQRHFGKGPADEENALPDEIGYVIHACVCECMHVCACDGACVQSR